MSSIIFQPTNQCTGMLTSRSSVTNFTGTNPGDENLCFF